MTTPSHASGPSLWAIARGSVLLWVGTLFSIVGLVFLTFGVRTSLEEHAYKTRGLDVQALVLERTLVRADHQDNPHTRYLVAYRFTSANGEVIDGTADVPVEEWERLEAGQPFAVTYLPGDPDSSRPPGSDEWIAALLFSLFGGLFALLGCVLAFAEGRYLVRAVRVLRHGLVTEGTVLRAGPTGTSINRVPQWRVHYRYRDHFGRTQEGASHLVSPEEGSTWKEGDRGTVRFDRERPEISLWVGAT
jgi:uncharacterized protein DUF3592